MSREYVIKHMTRIEKYKLIYEYIEQSKKQNLMEGKL